MNATFSVLQGYNYLVKVWRYYLQKSSFVAQIKERFMRLPKNLKRSRVV